MCFLDILWHINWWYYLKSIQYCIMCNDLQLSDRQNSLLHKSSNAWDQYCWIWKLDILAHIHHLKDKVQLEVVSSWDNLLVWWHMWDKEMCRLYIFDLLRLLKGLFLWHSCHCKWNCCWWSWNLCYRLNNVNSLYMCYREQHMVHNAEKLNWDRLLQGNSHLQHIHCCLSIMQSWLVSN